jgi:hypothetical protein
MSDSSYRVGRGRPPRQHQFKRGQSGNPAGRPKGARGLSQIVIEQLLKQVTVKENGKQIQVPALAAVASSVTFDALKGGDPKLGLALLHFAIRLDPPDHSADDDVAADEPQIAPEDATLLADYVAIHAGRGGHG